MKQSRIGLAFIGFLLCSISHAQMDTAPVVGLKENPARWHALTGATAMTAPGIVVENATIVIREGIVVAVGAELAPPAGAKVWDLSGATVTAGLIEPAGSFGLPSGWLPKPQGRPGPPPPKETGEAAASTRYWNELVTPERRAAEALKPDADAAAALRHLGFTTVNALPQRGLLRGESVVVNLNDESAPGNWIVAPGIHSAAFEYRSFLEQKYPSSLMGAIALMRQALYDAAWYRDAQRAYAKDVSLPRPATNLSLAALGPLMDGDQTLLVEATDELDYQRAVNVAREFDLRVALLGNGYEYRLADYLAEIGLALVVPLQFPETPDVERPETAANQTLEALSHWELAPSSPAFLEQAGIDFSFTARNLKKPATAFWSSVRKAIERGLTKDAALAALTTRPAALLGVNDRVGRIERGFIANLSVYSGDPFSDKSARVLGTWVDGDYFPGKGAEEPDPEGAWQVQSPGAIAGELVIAKKGKKLQGKVNGGKEFEVKISSGRVLFRPNEDDGLRVSADVVDDRLWGLAAMPSGVTAVVSATRGAPASNEDEDADEPEPAPELGPLPYPAGAYGRNGLPEQPRDLLLRNATLWTIAPGAESPQTGDIWIQRGRIKAVGPDLRTPRNAVIIDAAGKHVTPGIIDAHSHTAISRGINEGAAAISLEVRIGDVVDPTDIALYRELAGGVTSANLLHGSANAMGGQNQVIKLRWGGDADAMKFEGAKPGVKFALGENPKFSNFSGTSSRYPQTRMGVREIIVDTLERARHYGQERRSATRGLPPRRNLRLDAALEILEGERSIHIHSYRQDEILMFARLARDYSLDVGTFQHVLEGYKVADAIADIGAGGSTFSDWWAFKKEVYDAIPYNTAMMHRAGVVTSVNSDSNELARRLNLEAAKAIKYGGLTEVEALATITRNPAIQLKIDDRVGSLEPSKDADFVVWSGHPLSVYSRVEQTWIDGRRYYDREEDALAQRQASAERSRLIELALSSEPSKPENDAPQTARPGLLLHLHDASFRNLYHDGRDGLSCALEGV